MSHVQPRFNKKADDSCSVLFITVEKTFKCKFRFSGALRTQNVGPGGGSGMWRRLSTAAR